MIHARQDRPQPRHVLPEEYHRITGGERGSADFIMTNSQLKRFRKCPAAWLADVDEDKQTKSLSWGSLLDTLALTPDAMESLIAVEPDTYAGHKGDIKAWSYYSPRCREWRDAQVANGKIVVNSETLSNLNAALKMLHDDPHVGEVLRGCDRQVMVEVEWRDPATGIVVPVACLLDLVGDDCVIDLKTAVDASLESWPRTVYRYRYHDQLALYRDSLHAATGIDRPYALWAISEHSAPYVVGRRRMDDAFYEMGQDSYRESFAEYCQCLASDRWPTYDDRGFGVNIDGWTMTTPEPYMAGDKYGPRREVS